jgi:hypothetical protein
MINDLEFIHHTFNTQYAPMDWKRGHIGLDFTSELEKHKSLIIKSQTLSSKDFHQILNSFLGSFKDYHVNARYNSTETAYLPFEVQRIDNRCFITKIDEDYVTSASETIKVGDEILFFGNRPVIEVLNELEKESGLSSNLATDQSLADLTLTSRSGARGEKVPSGDILIQTLPHHLTNPQNHHFTWKYTPELITSPFDPLIIAKSPPLKNPFLVNNMLNRRFDDNMHKVGMKEGSLPNLGEVVYDFNTPDSIFKAYIYLNDQNRLIGYIRIPSYRFFPGSVDEFGFIMNVFQDATDAIVIDQMDNPGGSVMYLYTIASILATSPLKTPLHKMTINPQLVEDALIKLEYLDGIKSDDEAQELLGWGFPVSLKSISILKDSYKFIITEWNKGKLITSPIPIEGVNIIDPHPYYNYTKPILFLINELDFSGGDFLPAILQDNHRAVLMGTRTAGAGGFVLPIMFPNITGIDFVTFTGSLAERPDQSTIENLGVKPDIEYKITVEDITQNYKPYIKAINKTVQNLIK